MSAAPAIEGEKLQLPVFEQTTAFIDLIIKWWKVVNVNGKGAETEGCLAGASERHAMPAD